MSIYDSIKEVAIILQKADNIELYKKILEVQEAMMELVDENKKLKEEMEKLEEKSEISDELICEDDCYYRNKNGRRDGPFCTRCWDGDGKLVRVHTVEEEGESYYKCPQCAVCTPKRLMK